MIPNCEDKGKHCLEKYGEHCKVCITEKQDASMPASLLRAFAIGCEVHIYRDLNMRYIELIHKQSMHQRGQYLPLDNHLDNGIPGCIDICVKELLKDIDTKQIQND